MATTARGARRVMRLALTLSVTAIAAAVSIANTAQVRAATSESFTVNLASTRGTATGVGDGVLYGISQDGTQPADRFVQPLKLNAYRGGGHASGGWIADGYTYGTATKADVTEMIAQAKRLEALSPNLQYQVIMSDVFGADGSQPSNTVWPCTNGNCSSWTSMIDSVVGALQASGLKFSYDVWNEPDINLFWPNGSVNSTQYFQMWDAGVKEIRKDASTATIVGPSFAYTPLARASQWQTFLAHAKAAGTVPDWISNHDEGDGDDPVGVATAVSNALSSNGISARPLSANEYQPANEQTAGVTAWYLARFAQSTYTNAMRGNWDCCLKPNLSGLVTDDGLSTTGNWWVMRQSADLTGSLVTTSNQINTTAISASEDSSAKRAVAILGDENGYTGAASVTFSGLPSVSWLANNGSVNVVVDRIPDQSPLYAPLVVVDQNVSNASGSITVNFNFQAAHDAFAIYLTPGGNSGAMVGTGSGRCLDVPNGNQTLGTQTDIWDCNSQTNQTWHFTAAGELRTYNDTACLDAYNNGTANGTAVVIWTCNGQTNQKWTKNANGSFTGVQSGRCLDVSGAGTANGTKVDLWDCNGQTNQKWTLPNN